MNIKPVPGQVIGQIFSRTIWLQVEGYEPLVRRVSGTGFYKVQKVSQERIDISSTFLYDGRPVSTGDTSIRDGGGTVFWQSACSPSTDASGLTMNPPLWGVLGGKLAVGQTWDAPISTPWEVGQAGKQTIKVVSIDPANDAITLQRTSEGEGDSARESKTVSLVRDKDTYSATIKFGKARWSGVATFRYGLIMSDSLLVVREVSVSLPRFGSASGTQRQYILVNASSPDLLRDSMIKSGEER